MAAEPRLNLSLNDDEDKHTRDDVMQTDDHSHLEGLSVCSDDNLSGDIDHGDNDADNLSLEGRRWAEVDDLVHIYQSVDGKNLVGNGAVSRKDDVSKIERLSPGLARRMNPVQRENSPVAAAKARSVEEIIQNLPVDRLQERIVANLQNFSPSRGVPGEVILKYQSVLHELDPMSEPQDIALPEHDLNPPKIVENDLLGRPGSQYVGMRLAYFSSDSTPIADISSSCQSYDKDTVRFNDDNLTDIPLNGSAGSSMAEKHNFTLSPETTECDSVDVDSNLSDDGPSLGSGMPAVEDGLSSSQPSDFEDPARSPQHQPIPTKMDSQLPIVADMDVREFFSASGDDDTGSSKDSVVTSKERPTRKEMLDHHELIRQKKEAIELAIQDIKNAIEKTKMMTQTEDVALDPSQDPVWILRDSYRKKAEIDREYEHARELLRQRQQEQDIALQLERGCHLGTEDGDHLNRQVTSDSQASKESDTDEETDKLLEKQYHKEELVKIPEIQQAKESPKEEPQRRSRVREASFHNTNDGTVLIEGVLFRAKYLGSTTLISEGQPSKSMRMMQAQEAVGRIKAPEGEPQPSTEVDLFVSTEKIMVLNTNLKDIMMDHSLRTISYIADIGDIVVIMARRGPVASPGSDPTRRHHQAKICCHVFEAEEAQLIAQSIGQAFQVAYMEFLKANGINDPGMMKELDYQEVLNQQEIYGDELYLFANKEMQKEVIIPKLKGECIGVVIVESGWGSMVPTVVLANMSPTGPAARCGQLNIGDQIMAVNGVSLVGLPLSTCQNYIKATKTQTVVKLTVVPCAPVVEVIIKRPDVKYQLGFSVQNGVICSLLRGGIAERGGVRVGHRIIEINGQSVVAVAHEKIVNMLASAVGEIQMKTMPTSIYRLLTGQDVPHYI